MPNGQPKPVILLEGHRTKAEKEARKKNEAALKSGQKIKPSKAVKENAGAIKHYKRVVKMFKEIDMDDAFFENVINRYCLMLAESEEIANRKNETVKTIERLNEELKSGEIDFLIFIEKFGELSKLVASQERQLGKLRDQLLHIEKENLMTVQGKMRAVPKAPEKKEVSGIAAYMQRRESG